MTKPLYVTRPDLPEPETFLPYLHQFKGSNNGLFYQQAEQASERKAGGT